MILFAKRFRSKAPSAASLSSAQVGNRLRTSFGFLPTPDCDTVSGRGKGEGHLTVIVGKGMLRMTSFLLPSKNFVITWLKEDERIDK